MFAIDEGIKNFLGSDDCSNSLRKNVEIEQNNMKNEDLHFHDLVTDIIMNSLVSFLSSIAASVALEFFKTKILSRKEAKRIAESTARVKLNETRLKLGPLEIEKIKLSKEEITSLSEHVYSACDKIKD